MLGREFNPCMTWCKHVYASVVGSPSPESGLLDTPPDSSSSLYAFYDSIFRFIMSATAVTTSIPPLNSTTGWGVKLPDTVDTLRFYLYIIECLFGTFAIIIILLMWNCLGRISKINKNLDFVIKNAAIAMIVICFTR